ncbi:hypothetical protein NCAS_0D02780 [Naumovozyma castellii]|uniref:Dynein light intermediate chain n=1 Tax=Naumovozyma castellii TaxID=27288 RepID=G0VE68_NAUCA|nr:hypothetical protein NCAS_0D02780 [Naumovozyma castellii CBS 4309]CCC69859.1 hypothetical protein NCAS_0D02780 [Naumovozyma castellii CBS 4309]
MENQWETFLDLQNGNEFQKLNHTLIFCSPNKKSLSKIKKLLFEKDGGVNDDFELITFFNVSLKSIMSNKSGSLDVYMLYTPTDLETIDLMNTFTKGICSTSRKLIHWIFVLDWEVPNQKSWLRYLINSFTTLQKLETEHSKTDRAVWCINSEFIRTLFRSTTLWHSHHVDFIQQTLRSFCIRKHSSLAYIDNNSKKFSIKAILKDILQDDDISPVEMVDQTNILIPFGADSDSLIKTLDDAFDPTSILESEFISNFETTIPAYPRSRLQDNSQDANNDESSFYSIDLQERLSKIYQAYKT